MRGNSCQSIICSTGKSGQTSGESEEFSGLEWIGSVNIIRTLAYWGILFRVDPMAIESKATKALDVKGRGPFNVLKQPIHWSTELEAGSDEIQTLGCSARNANANTELC